MDSVKDSSHEEGVIRVGNATQVGKLASFIAKTYKQDPKTPIVLRAVGAFSLNQATKAVIIANRHMSNSGIIFYSLQTFHDIKSESAGVTPEDEDKKYTAINITLKPQRL